ncbi:ABC transporter ATP-binding protein [Micromonospora sp. NBC_01813]|uniref:ABC transporter ATP-binding protein n=1 Tax=Micromonospora sp. NBC_01813 TaxID=2975988 RepID=UPI002DDBBBC7|nr:ABC transporter ATP-binding protein [Micromonospora sp. NBC_01813]WSA08563.1 ABC transporter ATP-binding protein [Micromonospora sp. NBC_01813]
MSTITSTRAAATATGLSKVYGKGEAAVTALDGVDIEFAAGRFHAIMGSSGSGKSTLMHCLAGLDRPTAGSVHIGDTEITRLDDRRLTMLRRDRIGFVFQRYNLLPTLTAVENITLPVMIAGGRTDRDWLNQVVAAVGLTDRLNHRPSELSGGQQQRVAVARALITRPAVIFADEPTGNLDSRSGAEVLRLLRDAVDQLGQTVVMVTHDPLAATRADRVTFLADGRRVTDLDRPDVDAILDVMSRLDSTTGHAGLDSITGHARVGG